MQKSWEFGFKGNISNIKEWVRAEGSSLRPSSENRGMEEEKIKFSIQARPWWVME